MFSRLFALLIACGTALAPVQAAESPADKAMCAAAVAAAEQAARLPVRLLRAVSLAESGRWDPDAKASFAWPWTVTSGGTGQYFPDKAAAIAHVKRLQAKGVKNIDVGCMQVNLMHHGRAFGDLEEAFDPIHNVLYAAAFLKELRQERNSWSGAVATYHSADPERGNTYSEKVFALWHKENEREFKAALAAREALYSSRAAARQNQIAQR
jgi:soluble lytic murein transglycosylase-like protein